jgi:L-threonylcarbamoyladenylate synthase
MQIVKCGENSIKTAIEVLKSGGLVIYPTETLYGVGVDATNSRAVSKLTIYKNRPLGKPYSVAVKDAKMAEEYAKLNPAAKNLFREFLPGPLTIIVKGKHLLAPGVESEDGKLGIRLPDYKFVRDLVRQFGKPITATSANASYKKRPYKVLDILDNLSQKQKELIDLIVDAGTLPTRDPSTVIDTTFDEPVTLRQGKIRFSEKNQVLSKDEAATQNTAKEIWQKYESYLGKRSIVFALQGEMGAGKTQFTKGLAKAMGITQLVTSPTFAIENEYKSGKCKLYHFDAWRLTTSGELRALGFEQLIKNRSVISIEWAEKVADVVREFDEEAIIIWLKIEFGKGENERIISWTNM